MGINPDKFGVYPFTYFEICVEKEVSDEKAFVYLLVHLDITKARLLRVLEK